MLPPAGDVAANWQETQLLTPSEAQLERERRGRVVIYDGLYEHLVDNALDTQFGRIDSMMFIRMLRTDANGDDWADDDCD